MISCGWYTLAVAARASKSIRPVALSREYGMDSKKMELAEIFFLAV